MMSEAGASWRQYVESGAAPEWEGLGVAAHREAQWVISVAQACDAWSGDTASGGCRCTAVTLRDHHGILAEALSGAIERESGFLTLAGAQ